MTSKYSDKLNNHSVRIIGSGNTIKAEDESKEPDSQDQDTADDVIGSSC